MFKTYLVCYLCFHLVGEFYLQSERRADKKCKKISSFAKHVLIYWISLTILSLLVHTREFMISIQSLCLAHTFIDITKFFYIRKKREKISINHIRNIYIIDQVSHVITFIAAAYIMTIHTTGLTFDHRILKFFTTVNLNPIVVLSWITMLLAILKPANITIKQLLTIYRPDSTISLNIMNLPSNASAADMETSADTNAGAFIGSLERLVILIFLSLGQYSAIGLILTAKSIARYNRITTDRAFAEYYLLGTLLSMIYVLFLYRLIM
ncbi:DUF3307 domain-containing protein [Anaerosporobacter faecicola]|uniref:DUF3307 domain-containing protein n=1 Tax=Anaerosporobacter faecicola TaxID=2718714 RepID=UPI00143B41B3|nr:DUF3307 domain-containing protein [Anaerosporobacter faecicola]